MQIDKYVNKMRKVKLSTHRFKLMEFSFEAFKLDMAFKTFRLLLCSMIALPSSQDLIKELHSLLIS